MRHLSIIQSLSLLSILSLYQVTTAIVSSVLSVGGIVGQYRWFTSLLSSKRRRKLEKNHFGLYDEHVYGKWCDDDGMKEEFSILLADVDELGDGEQQMGSLVQMAQRVTSSLETFIDKEERAQLGIGSQLCTVELFCWPFGRNVYVLKNARNGQVTVDENVSNMVEIEYWTPKDEKRKKETDRNIILPKSIRIKTQLVLEDGQIKVRITHCTLSFSLSPPPLHPLIHSSSSLIAPSHTYHPPHPPTHPSPRLVYSRQQLVYHGTSLVEYSVYMHIFGKSDCRKN